MISADPNKFGPSPRQGPPNTCPAGSLTLFFKKRNVVELEFYVTPRQFVHFTSMFKLELVGQTVNIGMKLCS